MIEAEKIIAEHIHDENCYFVFPTQTAADAWIFRALNFPTVRAFSTERFLAWDDFKGSAIKSTQQNKRAVPAILRSLFSVMLIEKNARSPFLNYYIPREFAKTAERFSAWIADLLPSLSLWKKKFDEAKTKADSEDKDLLALYHEYKNFLDEKKLFEPAWETPPLDTNGKKYFVFYADILQDFFEYKTILENSPDVFLLRTDKEKINSCAEFFSNSQTELHALAKAVRQTHDEKKIAWSDIAVSVPDLETFAPYIEKEFSLRSIPFVIRNGKKLSNFGAGSFFSLLEECAKTNFSFYSLKSLLLNHTVSWKEIELNEAIIDFGKKNNCLYSFSENGKTFDVWKKSFARFPNEARLENYYAALKKNIGAIVSAKSFSEIEKSYFIFRNLFFANENWEEKNDRVISRCIAELSSLIDIEKEFPDCNIENPYRFFTEYLQKKMYVPQESKNGVAILSYKLASAAPYAKHFVIDANENALSVVYKRLPFLRGDKRELFGISNDENMSEKFIRLYELHSMSDAVYFSASEKNFSGYQIAQSSLDEKKIENAVDDFYENEKNYFLKDEKFPEKIFASQKIGFHSWCERQKNAKNKIDKTFLKNLKNQNEKIKISYTSLKSFYDCKQKFLFKNLKVFAEQNEAELMNGFALGNLEHAILQNFFEKLLEKKLSLGLDELDALSEAHKVLLSESIDAGIKKFAADANNKISELANVLIENAKPSLEKNLVATVELLEKEFATAKVFAVEKELQFFPENKNYFFDGRIDCLLENDDEIILLDFKSSESAIPKNIFAFDDTPDFQMPSYFHLLENQKSPIEIASAYFVCIDPSVKNQLKKVFDKNASSATNEKFKKTRIRFLELAENFANDIANENFSLDKIDFEKCGKCDYKNICRKTFTVSNDDEENDEHKNR